MAARLVSSISTILHERGCPSRYFLTVFLDSPTSTASTTRPLALNSLWTSSTRDSSRRQYGHQVVQNCSRTTFPLTDSLLNFSPSSVFAVNRGAGSRSEPAHAQIAIKAKALNSSLWKVAFGARMKRNIPHPRYWLPAAVIPNLFQTPSRP